MNPRATALSVAIAFALVAGYAVWRLRDREAGPAREGAEKGAAVPKAAGEPDSGEGSDPKWPGVGTPIQVDTTGLPAPGPADPSGGPRAPTPKETARKNDIERMSRIGNKWLERVALDLNLSESQRAEFLEELAAYYERFQDIRFARGVERDVETELAKLRRATEEAMKRELTPDQAAKFPGIPGDWGHGTLNPAPGR